MTVNLSKFDVFVLYYVPERILAKRSPIGVPMMYPTVPIVLAARIRLTESLPSPSL